MFNRNGLFTISHFSTFYLLFYYFERNFVTHQKKNKKFVGIVFNLLAIWQYKINDLYSLITWVNGNVLLGLKQISDSIWIYYSPQTIYMRISVPIKQILNMEAKIIKEV